MRTLILVPAQKSTLTLVSQSTTGNDAIYTFTTPSQASSDNTVESYTFRLCVCGAAGTSPGTIVVTAATPPGSATTLQVQEYPPDTAPFTALPRFADPLRSAIDIATFVDCVTNLLFPWVGSLPDFGYDTGIAIANTGYDVGAITPPTVGDPWCDPFLLLPTNLRSSSGGTHSSDNGCHCARGYLCCAFLDIWRE